jgi:hypothetical protein
MKRFVLLLASVVLSTVVIGCGEAPAPPAGKLGTGPETGPPTAGVAKRDRDKMFKDLEEAVAKKAAVAAAKKKR